MTPFETLISELGNEMEIPLKSDHHQSCLLNFGNHLTVQIDLAADADQVLIGSELGKVTIGSYRESILKQALRVNGLSTTPRGILAYSEKNDSLILFQYFPLTTLNGKKLWEFVQLFLEHSKIWKESLESGDIPHLEEDIKENGSGFFGLKP
ncbi:MAG: hypothetical protein K1000chlam4_00174 [Chlamydiae bacterium]|nr:hypothetical protein [Chlamydiota bacterium]